MKRKRSPATAVGPEDLMKVCGMLAKEAGLTDERRVFFTRGRDPKEGWLSGWTAQLNDKLEIEVDAVLRNDEDESGFFANGRIGHPLRAIWSVAVWPGPDDNDQETSPIIDIHGLPFAEALRIASAIIQTHKFKRALSSTA